MIVYGTGERKLKSTQDRAYTCPNCHERKLYFHLFRGYFHLFWIPFVPTSRRNVAVCENCETAYEGAGIPDELRLDLNTEKSMAKTPVYFYSGLALVIIAISAFAYFNDGTTTYDYASGNKEANGKMIGENMDGKWTFWHESGEVSSVQYFQNGIEDSLFTWWDENGNIVEEARYKLGLMHGLHTFYHSNGNKKEEETYVDGRTTGKVSFWYESGELSGQGLMERNLPEKKWTYWYKNGTISEYGDYKEGEKVGSWFDFDEDGDSSMVTSYHNNESYIHSFWNTKGEQLVTNGEGNVHVYYDNGNLVSDGQITNGLQDGRWEFWYETGQRSRVGKYVNHDFNMINSWTPEGKQMVIAGNGYQINLNEDSSVLSEGTYKNGFMEGEWIQNVEDGSLQNKSIYAQGKANGMSQNYFKTGELYAEGMMVDDVQDGLWTFYHTTGEIESTLRVSNGKKEGDQLFYSAYGTLVKKEVYEEGELISEEVY